MDRFIARVASHQHGVFTRAQAKQCGATVSAIRWRLTTGRWERLHPNVYRLAGSPKTWRQRALAACFYLGPAVPLSHRAAAFLRGLSPSRRATVEVIVPRKRNRTRPNDIIIHWLDEPIPPEDITTIDGIPVTKPARTLMDLATVEPEEVIERALDDALRRRLLSLSFLERWLQDPRRRRHRGARLLKRLVEERATIGVTESPLETKALTLLRDAGLPIPMLQYEVRDGDRFVGRLDFAYPDARVGIEADGFRYHDSRQAFDAERFRGNELQALGWSILRVTAKHLDEHPEEVAEWVRRALDRAL